MKFEAVPLSEAKGKILGHNIARTDGQRLLRKGKPLTNEELEKLRALNRTSVDVASLEPDDVERLAQINEQGGITLATMLQGQLDSGNGDIHARHFV